jgi:toxin ParE1/3/4
MAYQVVWSSQAIEDIDAIASYIARDSRSYTAAIVRKLIDEIKQLSESPLNGNEVFEFGDPNIREVSTYSYRVIYEVQEKLIIIATVVYSKALLYLEG